MARCLFCEIANGRIPSHQVWEDKDFMAFLDIFPNTEGMTVVIPKKHFPSYMFDLDDQEMGELVKAGKKVAKKIEQGLLVKRVALVMEGMGVNHVHLKLYPLWGLEKKYTENWSKEVVYYKEYLGYISTQLGPEKSEDELKRIAKKIRNAKN